MSYTILIFVLLIAIAIQHVRVSLTDKQLDNTNKRLDLLSRQMSVVKYDVSEINKPDPRTAEQQQNSALSAYGIAMLLYEDQGNKDNEKED